MDIKKWVPWNWFKKEEENSGTAVPVNRSGDPVPGSGSAHPLRQFHDEVDRLFDQAFRGFGLNALQLQRPFGESIMKPMLDLSATDKEYAVTVEIPGVDEKDVTLEIQNDTLTIRGEKKMETEEKNKNYYRMERSYGVFQRVLSLPEDVEQRNISAHFKKGILTVTLPRKAVTGSEARRIEVSAG